MPAIVEIIRMKMRAGVDDAEVVRASRRADAMFRAISGLERRLLLGPDAEGVWSDQCEYADQRSLDAAHDLVKKDPGEAASYFGLVDQKSVSSEQLAIRSQSEQDPAPSASDASTRTSKTSRRETRAGDRAGDKNAHARSESATKKKSAASRTRK